MRDLAIFGGTPLFCESLHIGRPNIGNRARFMKRLNRILDERWLTNDGECVRAFEKKIAQKAQVKHCVAMCNATVALEIAIRAAGLHGEVIVPAFTFIATAHALKWQEITPVFCDIDPLTHNIDPAQIEDLITPATSGILAVHLWGRPCNIKEITRIAAKHNLRVLFDAAHAFGASYQGGMIGGFGDAEIFSFHATKVLNTFEGGAVVTNDDRLAEKMRLMRNFGFAGYDRVIYLGTNGKMSEVAAAMGLTNLEDLPVFVEKNRLNYNQYQKRLAQLPGIQLIDYDSRQKRNYHYVVVEINENAFGVGRDLLVEILQAENIIARRYFYPGCHKMEPYRSLTTEKSQTLAHTERLAQSVMTLPNGTAVDRQEIDRICDLILFVARNANEILAGKLACYLSATRSRARVSVACQVGGKQQKMAIGSVIPGSDHSEAIVAP